MRNIQTERALRKALFLNRLSTPQSGKERELRNALDIVNNGSSIEISPPIHFRIEWAGSQEMFTASWRLARLSFIQIPDSFERFASMWIALAAARNPFDRREGEGSVTRG
jgi:hypothetical protein